MRISPSSLVVGLTIVATGCTLTFKEPVLEPLNTNRFYDAEIADTCSAVERVVADLGLEIKGSQHEERACLTDTQSKVFSDVGDEPTNHLKQVAWAGAGGFIGGRYTLTVTTRDVRDGGTRVRVTTRIEGYINEEFGYQVLRSKGLIEGRVFAAIGTALGTAAVEAR